MPRRRQQEDTTIATTNNAVLFFGAANPNGYLSQMFESEFTHYNKTYNCSEHFFQYAKAALFKDANSMRKILAATDPERQKALGKKVTPFDAEEWELEAYNVVVKATYLKFTVSKHATDLRRSLEATGDRPLAKASPRDKIWRIGLGLEAARLHKGPWPGRNLLGEAIMQVRGILRAEAEKEARARREAVVGGEAEGDDDVDALHGAEADKIYAEAKKKDEGQVGEEADDDAQGTDRDAEGEDDDLWVFLRDVSVDPV